MYNNKFENIVVQNNCMLEFADALSCFLKKFIQYNILSLLFAQINCTNRVSPHPVEY